MFTCLQDVLKIEPKTKSSKVSKTFKHRLVLFKWPSSSRGHCRLGRVSDGQIQIVIRFRSQLNYWRRLNVTTRTFNLRIHAIRLEFNLKFIVIRFETAMNRKIAMHGKTEYQNCRGLLRRTMPNERLLTLISCTQWTLISFSRDSAAIGWC